MSEMIGFRAQIIAKREKVDLELARAFAEFELVMEDKLNAKYAPTKQSR